MFAMTYQSPMKRARSTLFTGGTVGADVQPASMMSSTESAPERRASNMGGLLSVAEFRGPQRPGFSRGTGRSTDVCVGLDLDQHVRIDEAADLHHGRRRP